jgi:hypothetical protein
VTLGKCFSPETGSSSSQIIFITLFSLAGLAGVRLRCAFHQPLSKLCKTFNVLLSISNGSQYVTLLKTFSHPRLVIYSFLTAPIKTNAGIANRWETTNNKPPGSSIVIAQSEIGNSSQIIVNALFFCGRCVKLCCAFCQQTVQKRWAKTKPFC